MNKTPPLLHRFGHRIALVLALAIAVAGPATANPQTGQVLPDSKPAPAIPRDFDTRSLLRDQPPPQPPRCVAEFERMRGVLIRYPLGIPYELIAELSEADTVFTLVVNQAQEDEAVALFAENGVTMANVHFIHALTDGIYTRDYGPWFILDGNEDVAIVNHTYEAWQSRPHDDQIPHRIGDYFGIPVYDLGLVHVGGNFQCDGHGTAITTRKVYDQNLSFTESEIDSVMEAFLGIDRNVCLPYFEPLGLHHIDCWAKLLTPEKIVVKRVSESHPSYDRIERNVKILESMETCFGRPYQIYRVDEEGQENYTNSLILNGKVYVPLFESDRDSLALVMFEEALPGYEVNGFGDWWWYDVDALHCRTKELADDGMLYVDHAPLRYTDQTAGAYRVDVLIRDYSGAGLVTDSLSLFWRTAGTLRSYAQLPLLSGSNPDSFYAEIPAQPLGTTVEYYVRASDFSGRTECHPLVGELGPHTFRVKIDDEAPTVDHTPLGDHSVLAWAPEVGAVVRDNVAVTSVRVDYWINGHPQPSLPMSKREGYLIYEAELKGSVKKGDIIDYCVVAEDGTNSTTDPPAGTHRFQIVPMSPLLVWNPDPTPSSGEMMSQMLDGFQIVHDYSSEYHMPVLANYERVFAFLGIYWNNRILALEEAEAVADYLALDGDMYMEGGDCWAFDSHCNRYQPFFGISAAEDGTHDVEALAGVDGTLGGGMDFSYSGENYYMDELWALPEATGFFTNPTDNRFHALSFESGERRTIACSFEFGGLEDGETPSTKGWLLSRYCEFFDLAGVTPAADETRHPTTVALQWNGPNPMRHSGAVSFALPRRDWVTLQLYGIDGRLVRNLLDEPRPAGWHTLRWDGLNENGIRVAPGVYFCRLMAGKETRTAKIVCVR